ncbi:MAG: acyl-CoA dehydrogenase [Planctomycetota bacterium]
MTTSQPFSCIAGDQKRLAELQLLESRLRELVAVRDPQARWVGPELKICAEQKVFEWFHRREWHGKQWSPAEIVAGYLALSRACLTTAFVITQRTGACQRIESSPNRDLAAEWLPRLIHGEAFATVGISHLTTSRQYQNRPAVAAVETEHGFLLEGFSPWVTGAVAADLFVVGATLPDSRQVLLAVPRTLPGVKVPPANELLALQASQTGPVEFHSVEVPRRYLLQGPAPQVLQLGLGAGTGGLQTSTLALGLASSALDYLGQESDTRPELHSFGQALRQEWIALRTDLLAAADGHPVCSNERLRQRANSLVLRATQAALAVAKGAGFSPGHPVGRWCCEALFFLVWSCPQPVVNANLCELAGLAE